MPRRASGTAGKPVEFLFIILAAGVVVFGGIFLLRRLVAGHVDARKQEAEAAFIVWLDETGMPLPEGQSLPIHAYGNSAIGFPPHVQDMLLYEKGQGVRTLSPASVTGWYVGAVTQSIGLDTGPDYSGDNPNLERTTHSSYLLIYGEAELLLVKIGILDRKDESWIAAEMEKICPEWRMPRPGSLKKQGV